MQEIHLFFGCLEFWHRDVGGDELWRATLLELEQSGRYQGHREGGGAMICQSYCHVHENNDNIEDRHHRYHP